MECIWYYIGLERKLRRSGTCLRTQETILAGIRNERQRNVIKGEKYSVIRGRSREVSSMTEG